MDDNDNKEDFYINLYEELYSQHGYHASNDIDSTHYKGLFNSCIDPSNIQYKTVLDIGCSAGIGIKKLFEPRGKICEGIDVSETAIKRAKSLGVSAQVASITNVPFDDNSFDLVCSTDVIEHLKTEDQEQAWTECFRTSKKYVAHKISNTPEGNKFDNKVLHLTCWSHDKWLEFFHSLDLNDWKIIYSITPSVWEDIKYKVYWMKEPPSYDTWNFHNTCLVFEKAEK